MCIHKNFANFRGMHLCRSLFLIKLQVSNLQLYWKKRLQYRCFLMNFETYFPANICWSSRRLEDVFHVLKTFSTRLQRNNFSSYKTSLRRLAKTSWRRLGRQKIVTLKTSWRHVSKTSWRQTKCLLGISVSNHGLLTNLNRYLTNLSQIYILRI